MTTGNLETFLHRAADLIDAAGGKVAEANDVRAFADQLRPFAGLTLRDFAEFLVKAEAYSRGELEPVFPKPKAKVTGRSKAAADPNRVANAVATLKMTYDRALDHSVTDETVSAVVDPLEKFTVAELGQVAAECGFQQVFKTKKPALAAFKKWILGRKGAYERAGA